MARECSLPASSLLAFCFCSSCLSTRDPKLVAGDCSLPASSLLASFVFLSFFFRHGVPLIMKTLFPPFFCLSPVPAGFCVSTHTPRELLDFRLRIGFSRMTPPDDGDDDDGETKPPRGSRPSPAPAPRNKIIPFGVP